LIRTDASAAEYWALITSFWVRNDSILAWSVFCPSTSVRLLGLELLALLHDPVELSLHCSLAGERLAGEVFLAGLERRARLAVELLDLLLHARVLELEPLLRGRHVPPRRASRSEAGAAAPRRSSRASRSGSPSGPGTSRTSL